MTIEMAEYNASLVLPSLSAEAVQRIEWAAQEMLAGIIVDVGPRHLDFDYSGRDMGRKIVRFLCRVAPLIGEAEGEVSCRLTTDRDETCFEFYAIRHSRLYRQEAELVRRPPAEVCPEPSALRRLTAPAR